MRILITIFVGLIIGIVAKLLVPGRDPGGFIVTILLGIAGAILARWVGRQLGWYKPQDPAGFFASVGGAVVVLLLYRLFHRARTRV
ncbi:MAG TPA: GlsB/YeaQ/YmgE family stress response membrane protein [Candidatus Angelobacter sp.]|nr:GlsB/YeaQ/YmgE family stress response membrane protein [Candidatus Angelobacter sp.]